MSDKTKSLEYKGIELKSKVETYKKMKLKDKDNEVKINFNTIYIFESGFEGLISITFNFTNTDKIFISTHNYSTNDDITYNFNDLTTEANFADIMLKKEILDNLIFVLDQILINSVLLKGIKSIPFVLSDDEEQVLHDSVLGTVKRIYVDIVKLHNL